MKRVLGMLAALLSVALYLRGQDAPVFSNFFRNQTLRLDYMHGGDARQEWATLDRLWQEGVWAGSTRQSADPFNVGRYRASLIDGASGQTIFSRGFDSYFAEYKTTDAALHGVARTYQESVRVPLPIQPFIFLLECRDRQNNLKTIFRQEIDPVQAPIIQEKADPAVDVLALQASGEPQTKVDLALVAEGYTRDQEGKFRQDAERLIGVLFHIEPYKSLRSQFNICGLFKPSAESGCDEPARGSFRRTAVQAAYDALGLERYLLTEDNADLQAIAAAAPCDALVILVNHSRYGGGGIYNDYCVLAVDSPAAPYLLVHEFGHAFAGLADEYYTSAVAYNEFYPAGVEPLEANITALLEPHRLKWQELVNPRTPVPTPWGKEQFEKKEAEFQKRRSELSRRIAELGRQGENAAAEQLKKELDALLQEQNAWVENFFKRNPFRERVGAFEGAGYAAKGLYRPMLDCVMFSRRASAFCKVCEQAIARVIHHYAQ